MTKSDQEFRFPCTQCGAELRFSPGSDTLVCDHCGTVNTVPQSRDRATALAERDYLATLNASEQQAEMQDQRLIHCNTCGAEFDLPANTQATQCPFCASSVVTDTGAHRRIKPAALLPFAKSEPEARSAMTTWLGALWFAPNGLQEYARKGRTMQGIYVPYWTYDADTKSRYTGQRGTIYYVTETVRVEVNGRMQSRQQQVQKIRWSSAAGRVARWFDDILVLATTSLPKRYTDALQPWDMESLVPYQPDYLAGFNAESYTVSLKDGFVEARRQMDQVIDGDVRADIGGDRQRVDQVDTTVRDVTFKHILLPVWLAAYKYRGKSYRFVVNGRTGVVQGERPWSWVKITFAVIAAAIVAGVVGYFLSQNQ